MIDSAVILAGGLGTRLASVVSDVPKPMAPVAGRPFLEFILDDLHQQGVTRAVLAIGHLGEHISGHFGSSYKGIELLYSRETMPLGTGGALRDAVRAASRDRILAMNGDSWCPVDLGALARAHGAAGALATLSLVRVADASRFGTVDLDAAGRVVGFVEKTGRAASGLINAGIYALDARVLDAAPAVGRFSFEKDVLEARAGHGTLHGYVVDTPLFIDIGVPADYQRAQSLFARS